ncbi:MAG: PilZ domain-containing protein [Deltaproteobacteria bacterium]|nr:PilZ domain-containing protein [Deltaproteobacteria bacterium]
MDISEQGMMIDAKQNPTPLAPGTVFSGSLTFPDGESLLVIGKIARVMNDKISIELSKPIPLKIMMSEQRRIIQKFKKRV